MDILYPLAYLASLGGLVSWFLFQGNKRISRPASAVFLIGFLIYLVSLSMASAGFHYKLLILFRDLVVLGIISQLYNVFRKSILSAIALTAIAGAILYFSYFSVLVTTFPQIAVSTIDRSSEFLVLTEGELTEENMAKLQDVCNCEVSRPFVPAAADATNLDEYLALDILSDKKSAVKKSYSRIKKLKFIKWIEPNEEVILDFPASEEVVVNASKAMVNDPAINRQWGFNPMNVHDLHRNLLKQGAKPRRKAHIAIIDSGVDAGHEDLKRNYSSFKSLYDKDPLGHGTHCAGIAGAVSNNKIGIASFAPSSDFVEITGYTAINASGVGSQKTVIKAMIEAVDNGADVLSMSLGGKAHWKREQAYAEAVAYANKHGAIVVVAAGNNSSNAKTTTPANVDGVIAVSALSPDLMKAPFSNSVQDLKMAVAAPGMSIYSTYPGNQYKALNGTSMATPHVAGLIGLMKAFRPDLTTEEAFTILDQTGQETSEGATTGKLIQPNAALNEVLD